MLIGNRYQALNEFDKGGMGEIILCEDIHLQRRVVLKRLQVGVEARRLLDEQKALLKVRSKYVVQLFDIVYVDEPSATLPAIILEFIEGKTLQTGSFSIGAHYMNVIWQISCGLADIHSNEIIHRDIKPDNLMLDNEGVVKILDFGLSRSNSDAETMCIIGTPTFMAPELWGDPTIAFDSSIDVYAFGVTCVMLLTNVLPQSMFMWPPRQPSIEDFSSLFPGMPSEVTNILHQCLTTESQNRPPMKDIKKMLEKYLLKDRHRAIVILDGVANILDCNNRKMSLNAPNVGSITIEYNGHSFIVTQILGAVYINNAPVNPGAIVPGCCVLTFGNCRNRKFVTFDVSNPEVMP